MNRSIPLDKSHWLTTTPVAHRGLHRLPDTPENSLAAFEAAAQAGYAIEIDVYLIADGSLVVFHDGDLERMTGVAGKIVESTAVSLRDLRLLATKEHIPLFPETLAAVNGRAPFLIEIKSSLAASEASSLAVLAALDGYRGPYAIQCFEPNVVRVVKATSPSTVCGLLVMNGERIVDVDYDFVACDLRALPSPQTSAVRASGVPVVAWTIRTEEELEKAREVSDNLIFEFVSP